MSDTLEFAPLMCFASIQQEFKTKTFYSDTDRFKLHNVLTSFDFVRHGSVGLHRYLYEKSKGERWIFLHFIDSTRKINSGLLSLPSLALAAVFSLVRTHCPSSIVPVATLQPRETLLGIMSMSAPAIISRTWGPVAAETNFVFFVLLIAHVNS